jgi:hypothetical protein
VTDGDLDVLQRRRALARELLRPPSSGENDRLASLGYRLSAVLDDLADDEQLWADIEAVGEFRLDERTMLFLVGQYEWEPILEAAGYIPPPKVSFLVESLLEAARAAQEYPIHDHLNLVRQRLSELSGAIVRDANAAVAQMSDPALWDRLAAKLGIGWRAARRLGLAKEVFGSLGQGAAAGIAIAAGGPVAVALGAAVAGIAKSVIQSLGDEYVKVRDEHGYALKARSAATDVCLADLQRVLSPSAIGRWQAGAELIARAEPGEQVRAELRGQMLAVGGLLIELWALVGIGASQQFAVAVEQLIEAVDEVESLITARGGRGESDIPRIRDAVERLSSAYASFRAWLTYERLPGHH